MEDKKDFVNGLVDGVDAWHILYEDVSDDGDGDIQLTGVGEELYEFIQKEIDRTGEEEEEDDVNVLIELLKKHSLVKDVHFYRGDNTREIIINLN